RRRAGTVREPPCGRGRLTSAIARSLWSCRVANWPRAVSSCVETFVRSPVNCPIELAVRDSSTVFLRRDRTRAEDSVHRGNPGLRRAATTPGSPPCVRPKRQDVVWLLLGSWMARTPSSTSVAQPESLRLYDRAGPAVAAVDEHGSSPTERRLLPADSVRCNA